MRKMIEKTTAVVIDPLKHISLGIGDGLAVAWISFFIGLVVDRAFGASSFCWYPA